MVAERLVSASVDLNSRYPKAHSVMREFAPRSDEIVREFRDLVEGVSVRLVPHLARAGVPEDVALMRARLFVAAADGQIHQLIGGKSTDPAALARAIVDHSTGNGLH
ncbi:hypothetical protein B2J88_44455 [Rhodococcus sp. SRB_17]|nr:hypothetical protein [Rhodococcus sp. SRB_17]